MATKSSTRKALKATPTKKIAKRALPKMLATTKIAAEKVTASKKIGAKQVGNPSIKEPCKRVTADKAVYDTTVWNVSSGMLEPKVKRTAGRPLMQVANLFRVIGEKLPFAALTSVRDHLQRHGGDKLKGVYIAHDSMGCPRYIGRGNIFTRLATRKKEQQLELEYFSFYIVSYKKQEREVETLLIRAAGFLLEFNEQKKQVGHWPGNPTDYEIGTAVYARRYKKPR